jgi:hypothetical protein
MDAAPSEPTQVPIWYRGRWVYVPPVPPPTELNKPTQNVLFGFGLHGEGNPVLSLPPDPPVEPGAVPSSYSAKQLISLPRRAEGALGSLGGHLSTNPPRTEAYQGQAADRQPPADIYRTAGQVDMCGGHLEAYGHADHGDGAHRWFIPRGCCAKAACANPGCVARITRERARRVLDVYDRLRATVPESGPLRMGAIVFTFPSELRDELRTEEGRRRAVEAAWECVTWWECSIHDLEIEHRSGRRRRGWRLGGVSTWHPEGDGAPGDWHPHIHLQVASWAWTGEPECDCAACRPARWARLRVRVTEDEIRLLHRMWGIILAERFGWQPPSDLWGNNYGAVDVDYKYRSTANPAKWVHRIRYDVRHWPRYRGHWRRVRWHGYLAPRAQSLCGLVDQVDRESGDRDRIMYLCPVCGQRSDWDRDIGVAWGCIDDALVDARAPPWMAKARTVQ